MSTDTASTIEALNVRIARLAIGLGVSLKSDADVRHAMQRQPMPSVPIERRSNEDRRGASRHNASAERRTGYQWEELRGLLVLRYGVEAHSVETVGVAATRQIMVDAHDHLVRDGFESGADGIDLNRLFNAP